MLSNSEENLFGGINSVIGDKLKKVLVEKCSAKEEDISDLDDKEPEDKDPLNEKKEKITKKDVEEVEKELEKVVDKIEEGVIVKELPDVESQRHQSYDIVMKQEDFDKKVNALGLTTQLNGKDHIEAIGPDGKMHGWWNNHTGLGYFHRDYKLNEETIILSESSEYFENASKSLEKAKKASEAGDTTGFHKHMVDHHAAMIKHSESTDMYKTAGEHFKQMKQHMQEGGIKENFEYSHPYHTINDVFGEFEIETPITGFNVGLPNHKDIISRLEDTGEFSPNLPIGSSGQRGYDHSTSMIHKPSGQEVNVLTTRLGDHAVTRFLVKPETAYENTEASIASLSESFTDGLSDNEKQYHKDRARLKRDYGRYVPRETKIGNGIYRKDSVLKHASEIGLDSPEDFRVGHSYSIMKGKRPTNVMVIGKTDQHIRMRELNVDNNVIPGDETLHDIPHDQLSSIKAFPLKHEPLKEEIIEEAKMTSELNDAVEKYVLKLKEKKADFKERYGDDWESVIYATATKLAKNDIGVK